MPFYRHKNEVAERKSVKYITLAAFKNRPFKARVPFTSYALPSNTTFGNRNYSNGSRTPQRVPEIVVCCGSGGVHVLARTVFT